MGMIMKDQRPDAELNLIIAEWCGWTGIQLTALTVKNPWLVGYFPGCTFARERLPSYCTDLNAIHEAEKNLIHQSGPNNQGHPRYRLASQLYHVTVPDGDQPCFATARQRAEALVAVIEASK